jgi:hypothetical protein
MYLVVVFYTILSVSTHKPITLTLAIVICRYESFSIKCIWLWFSILFFQCLLTNQLPLISARLTNDCMSSITFRCILSSWHNSIFENHLSMSLSNQCRYLPFVLCYLLSVYLHSFRCYYLLRLKYVKT